LAIKGVAPAAGAQNQASVQQKAQSVPGLRRASWVSGVTWMVSSGQGYVVLREVFEGRWVSVETLVSVYLWWALVPVQGPKQVPVLLEWFLVF